MAMSFDPFNSHLGSGSNSSNSGQNFGLNDDAMDLHFLLNDSNFGQNQNRLLLSNNSSQPHHRNELISQRSQPTVSPGQLGLSQRIADAMRRLSYPAAKKVHVHSVIDYNPVQNQPGVSEVTVTEVVKTQFLTATSTRDLLFAPNDIVPTAREPSFPYRSLLLPNQLSQPVALSDSDSSDSIYHHNRSQNKTNLPNMILPMSNNQMIHPFIQSDHMDHQNCTQNQSNIASTSRSAAMSNPVNHLVSGNEHLIQNVYYQKPTLYRSKPGFPDLTDHSMAKSDASKDQYASNHDQNRSHDQIRCQELLDEFYRNQLRQFSSPKRVPSNQMKVPREFLTDISEDEGSDDGRTHSLPRSKDGPYICPKCKDVFHTSQFFAAHVSSAHYKYETITERRRRYAAKFKNKKKLKIFQSSDGLTIVPNNFSTTPGRRKKAKRAIRSEGIKVQKQEEKISGRAAVEDFLVDVMIKQEYK